MFRRTIGLVISLVMTAAVLAGCAGSAPVQPENNVQTPPAQTGQNSQPAPAPAPEQPAAKVTQYPVTVTDSAGRAITIAAEPQRVITNAPSNSELIFALNKQSVLVGRSDFDDYPAEVANIPSIGGWFPPNFEQIVSVKPDLAILLNGSVEHRDKLEQEFGIVTVVLDPTNFDQMYQDILNLGVILNAQEAAEKLVADMSAKQGEITSKVAKATSTPKVFYELSAEPQIWTAGSGSFMDDLIRLAGGVNAAAELDAWGVFSLEQLVAANPDVIITNSEDATTATLARDTWQSIAAVKDGKVFTLDDPAHVQRPGPRMILGLEWLAKTLHPDLFK